MKNDRKFIERLYYDYYKFVYRVAANTLHSKIVQDTENCAHDVFVAAMKAEQLGSHANIKGWLGATTKNIAMQYNRRYLAEQRRITDIDECSEPGSDMIAQFEETEVFREMIEKGAVRQIFDEFTDNEKVLYGLRYRKGMKYSEISELLGVSESALMTRNHRLVAKVRNILKAL